MMPFRISMFRTWFAFISVSPGDRDIDIALRSCVAMCGLRTSS